MATGKRKKGPGKSGRSAKSGGARNQAARQPLRAGGSAPGGDPTDPLNIDSLVSTALKGGRELLTVDDPLEAEDWASGILGAFYKLPVPFLVAVELANTLGPALVQGAERMRNRAGLAILCALAAVTDEPDAREAARRMMTHGVTPPPWAAEIGAPKLLGVWSVADPFGDQVGYYMTFRYAERPPHLVLALYDENLGGIIKDAAAGPLVEGTDLRRFLSTDPDVEVREVDPAQAATHIARAIAVGDQFLDNHWTAEFKHARALLLARLRIVPGATLPEPGDLFGAPRPAGRRLPQPAADGAPQPPSPPQPPDLDAQEALIQEFLASPPAAALTAERETTIAILDHGMTARCDFGDGDPLRWSPAVVDLFMLDYLPRKATLSFAEIGALPEVLTAWVRFALTKRGLAERFIVETEQAVARFAAEFRQAVTDPKSFGPAKAIMNVMRADGVDVTDQQAIDAWMTHFNDLPEDERRSFFGHHLDS